MTQCPAKAPMALLTLLLFFVVCSKPTDPDAGSVRGKVILEGDRDHSGVRVSLYLPTKLDTALVSLKRSEGRLSDLETFRLWTTSHFPCSLSLVSDEMMAYVGQFHFASVDLRC